VAKAEKGASPAAPGRKRRARRTPDEARLLILQAAERVFAKVLPDTAGLKVVADEAGVSHALVTHYFGTYEALVDATLERRFQRLRDELLPSIFALVARGASGGEILAAHRSAIMQAAEEPTTVRLAIWAMLSGRADANDFFPQRVQGLRVLVEAIAEREKAPREDLEFAMIASLSFAIVWTVGKRALAGALARKASSELDARVERQMARMIDAFLRE
jgi:AcrR family transcriptional regulator